MAHHRLEGEDAVGTSGKRSVKRPAPRAERGSAHRAGRNARLRESSQQFRLAQEALGFVTWVWDVATDRVQWHGDMGALLGLARGVFSGRFAEYLACMHPGDLSRARQRYTDCLRGRVTEYRAVERVVWPDESIHWLETYGRAEHDAEGRALRMMGAVKEVTERRLQEERERQTRDKYEALFAASPEAIAIARRADGVMLEVNGAWERATGHSRAEAIGRSALELGMWLDPALRGSIVARIDAEGAMTAVPARFVRRDGSVLDALLSGARVELEGEACVVWSWSDVTVQRQIEQKAREAERKFAALFESSPIGLIVTRPRDRRVIEISDEALGILGLRREEAIGMPTLELATIVDRGRFEALRLRALAGERTQADVQVVRRDGQAMDLLFSTSLVTLEGEPHFVVSFADVTDQRRAERERIVADARYRRLFESVREGMFITAPDHTIVDVNPAACELSGYAARELVGRNAAMLYAEADLRRQPFRTDLTARWSTLERVLTRSDGRRMDIEVAAGPMPDGNVLAIVRDITERKRGETLLMNVARGVSAEVGGAFFRSLVEHLARELGADYVFIGELVQPDNDRVRTRAFVADGAIVDNIEYRLEGSPCIHAVSRRGTVLHTEGTADLFPRDAGLKRLGVEAYVGTSLTGAGGAALGVLVVMHRKPVLRGAYWASMIEIFAARAAAEIERARAEALVLRTNASLEEVVRERTAQLEEANRELESYNFSISHDLRQPLNAICGFSELLRESGETGRGDPGEYVREIESNAARMEQMIEALLRLSRAGRGTLRREPIDVRAMVQAVAGDLGAGPASVHVADLPGVRADPVLLRQVWTNLIGNALKYSRHSPAPRVEIGGGRRDGVAEFHVRDNGVGFDMGHARRLFTAFQRLPSAADYEGTGVGLAIVERIVRRHGGSIAAEAEPGRGATFRFSLPDEGL